MPWRREPLPPALKGEAFSVAQGRALGLGRGRLLSDDLARPFRAIRVQRADDHAVAISADQILRDRCQALLLGVPDGAFFSHVTAARIWPLPLPRPEANEPLHVSVPATKRAPRRAGVTGHHVHDPRACIVHRDGLAMVDPASLFCQLSTQLSLADLVAVGDALVLTPVYYDWRDERPWVPLAQLKARVELFRGRGKRLAAEAVELIRAGAESRPESLLRLAIRDAGLPEPDVNVDVFDVRGRFLGRADLVYRKWRVIVEYDGDQHGTDTRQFDKDVLRLEGFTSAGWAVVRVVGRSFFGDRDASIARVRRALTEAGWRA